MDVELRNFVAFTRSRIRDVDADLGGSSGLDLRGLDAKVFEFESRIAQAVAEGESGLRVLKA